MTNHELDQRSVVGGHHMPTRELYLSPPQIAQGRGKKMENYSQVEIRIFTEAQCSLYHSRLNTIVKIDVQFFSSKV